MSDNRINQTFFPHATLAKVFGEPNYQNIHDVMAKLGDNASAVKTTLGGGNHGLLAVLMTPAEYHNITGQMWVEPVHPGTVPDMAVGTTAVQARNIMNQHNENLRNFDLVNDTRNALKQQLLEAFDELYLLPLRDRQLGYANVTPQQMMTYL